MALKHLVPLGVRNFLRPTYQWAYAPIHRMTQSHAQWKQLRAELAEWERKGRPVPPPHIVKQQALRQYAARYNLHVLVETGTYNGDMVEAMRAVFDRIYSIELSKELYEKARSRFRGVAHIELMHGDSGSELKGIMSALWPVRKKMSHSQVEQFSDATSKEYSTHKCGAFGHRLQFASRQQL